VTTLPWRLEVLPASAAMIAPRPPVAATGEAAAPSDETPWTPARAPALEAESGTAATELVGTAPIAAAGSADRRTLTAATWFIVVWIAGVALVLGRLVLGAFIMAWLGRRGAALDEPAWAEILGFAARQLGVTTRIRLVKSDHVPMPMTAGLLRPVIVLPAECDDWTTDRKLAVLLHELAHVRRGDLWIHFLAQAACACYWFHPLAWSAARRLRSESERACDDLVLSAGTRASEYAGHLLQLVRRSGYMRAPAVALPMAQRSDFEGRLLAILEPGLSRRPLGRLAALATAAAFGLFVVPLAAMSPTRPESAVFSVSQNPTPTPTPTPTPAPRPRTRVRARPDAQPLVSADINVADLIGVHAGAAVATAVAGEAAAIAAEARVHVNIDPQAVALVAREAVRGVADALAQSGSSGNSQVSPAALRGLIEALRDADVEVRRHAASALGSIDDTAAINALADALRRDADASVRKTCAWALGEIEDPRAVAALVEALRTDKDAEVRKTAAWALGEIEHPSAIEGLGAALNDASPEVRKTAVWALGEIEDQRAVPVLVPFLKDSDLEIRKTAVWALGEIESPTAVSGLATLVSDPNREVRKQVAWALGEIESPAAIDPLTTMLKDEDVEVRSMAVWALGEIEDPRAAPAVAAVLRDANAQVRQKAAWALGEMNAHEAPAALIEALKDASRDVRKTAAWALGEIGDPAAVPGLAALLRDSDTEVRRTALWALGEIDDMTALDAIVAALKDSDPEVRRAAAQALGKHR
jgi:HEAT repeat protein/beta-lactamase regulating signal transducer with metallopeptidase domain